MILLNWPSVERYQFVADDERKLRHRQGRAINRVDQHLAVVNVDAHRQRRAERCRKCDGVVGIVQRRDVFDQSFLKVEIVRVLDALQPRRQPQQVESLHIAFPFVGTVVLGVLTGELREIRDSLVAGQGVLRVCAGDGQDQEKSGYAEATHAGPPIVPGIAREAVVAPTHYSRAPDASRRYGRFTVRPTRPCRLGRKRAQ